MLTTKLDDYLHKAIIWQFIFLILTTPLVWMEINSELFEMPKMILVYFLTGTLTATFIARMIVCGKIIWTKHWFNKLVWLFLGSQLISTVFSMHIHTSLFGYPTRLHQGLFATLSYTLIYFIFISNLNRTHLSRILASGVASLFIASLIAFPEHFGYALSCGLIEFENSTPFFQKFIADCWQQDIVNRVFGTFGQPNWLAAFIVTLIPFGFIRLYSKTNKLTPKSFLLTGLIGISFSTLLFTKSRSGLLALAVGFGVFLLLQAIAILKDKRQIPKSYFINLISSLLLPLFLFGSPFTPSVFDLLKPEASPRPAQTQSANVPLIERGGTESGEIRQIVWRGGLDVFANNFLVGSGVETFAYAYYNYRPVEHNQVSEWDFLYNKAHNEFLNLAATSGLFGLLTYLGLLFGNIYLAFKYILKHPKEKNSQIMIAIIASQTGLAVSNFFGFSTVMVGVWMYLLFGIGVILSLAKDSDSAKITVKDLNYKQYIGLGVLILLILNFSFLIFRYYSADVAYAKGTSAESQNDLTEAIVQYQKAIEMSPSESRFYNDYADALSKASLAFAQSQNTDAATRFAQQAILASAKTLELNPVHINYYKSQAGVMIRLSSLYPPLLEDAKKIMEFGQQLAPTDAKLMYNIGLINLDLEATDSAQAKLEEAVAVKPNYEEARLELAQIYESKNLLEQAKAQYSYILEYIAPKNSIARKALERLEGEEI